MAFSKFGSLELSEILETRSAPAQVEGASLDRFSSYNEYRTDDGYIYTRVRAISSRVNKNFDGWPAEELQKAYRTFIGKPIFVDHHNSDHKKSRGVIVDAILHVEDSKSSAHDEYYSTAPDNHKPPTWIELLLETDAKAYPKLAQAIVDKDIDGVSMGCNVEKTRCSVCSKYAYSPEDFCTHVKLKGGYFDSYDNMGKKSSKLAYEDCYDIGFFEISYVFDPADTTALVHEVKTARYDEGGPWSDENAEHWDFEDEVEVVTPDKRIVKLPAGEAKKYIAENPDARYAAWPERDYPNDDEEKSEQKRRQNNDPMQNEIDNIRNLPETRGPSPFKPEEYLDNGMETLYDSANPLHTMKNWELDPADPAHVAEMDRRRQVGSPDVSPQVEDVWNAGPAPREDSAAERFGPNHQDAFQNYLQQTAPQSEFTDPSGAPVETQSDLDQFQHPNDPRSDPVPEPSQGGAPGWVHDMADILINDHNLDFEVALDMMLEKGVTEKQARAALMRAITGRESAVDMVTVVTPQGRVEMPRDQAMAYVQQNPGAKIEQNQAEVYDMANTHGLKWANTIDSVLKESGFKLAENPVPQSMELSVPEAVDTLRQETVCPICGSEMDSGECAVCHYVEPPAGFDNPDLGLSQQIRDMIEQSGENLAQGGQPPMPAAPQGMPGNAGDPMPGTPGPPTPGTMASTNNTTHSHDVKDEWEVAIRSRVASRINKNELPILPPTRITSDMPSNPKVVQNSLKPVESNSKEQTVNMSNWNDVAKQLAARKLDPTKVAALAEAGVFEKLIERLGADAVTERADFPNTDIDSRGQLGGDPTKDAQHVDVEKPLKEEVGPETQTFGDNSAPTVTSEDGSVGQGPIGSPIHSGKTANPIPGSSDVWKADAQIDVEKPLNKEEVGEPTKTWGSDPFHITDPVTNEVGPGNTVSAAKTHWMKALKVAETEIQLGLLPEEEKYDRIAILDGQSPEQVEAVGQTLAMVRKANLRKAKTMPKAPAGLGAVTAAAKAPEVNDGDEALFM